MPAISLTIFMNLYNDLLLIMDLLPSFKDMFAYIFIGVINAC